MTTPIHLHYRGGAIPVTAVTFHAFGAERRVSIRATGSANLPELDFTLSLSPLPPVPGPSLAQLRRAAADAHPDRGGDPEQFRAAHAAYVEAKGRAA
jgi:hypothetical protein